VYNCLFDPGQIKRDGMRRAGAKKAHRRMQPYVENLFREAQAARAFYLSHNKTPPEGGVLLYDLS
jgi:hypothetical protein